MADFNKSSESKPSVRNAVFWNTASKFLQEGVRFVISIILARLIDPTEFGIVAMVLVFISISNRLTEGGFRSAIIKTEDLDSSDCSTALTTNISLAFILSITLWLTSPFIANFYNEPILETVVPLLAIGLMFDATSIVQAALFTKRLKFKEQAVAGFIAAIATGVVGIGMAMNNYGLWALVISALVGKAFNSLILWILSDWKPDTPPSLQSFKKLFGYSSKVALSGLIENISNNILPLFIGKFYGAASLGFYNRANSFKEIPTNNIYLITQPIIFSKLSLYQSNPMEFKKTFRRSTRLLAFIVIPAMIFIIITAKPLVLALVGAKWLPSVILLQILCIVGIFHQMMRINNDALLAKGFAGVALKQEILRKIMYLLTIFFTYQFGLETLLYGIAIQTILSYLIMIIVSDKIVNLKAADQIKDALPYTVLSILSIAPVVIVSKLLDIDLFLSLIISGVLYMVSYFMLNRIFRFKGLDDFLILLLKRKPKISVPT